MAEQLIVILTKGYFVFFFFFFLYVASFFLFLFFSQEDMAVGLLVLVVVEEAIGVDLLLESSATLVRGCERSTGTSMSFPSFKRTSTRSTQMSPADHL